MAYYSIEKRLKTAEIGTILPWAGDTASSLSGWENQTNVGIPPGWIICDGGTKACINYPLLANAIGTTYGGLIGGSYPDYLPTDTFKLPNIQGRHLANYDTSYLPADTEVQQAISPLMGTDTDNSVDVTPQVSADLNFSVTASNTLVGRSTGLEITDPTYFKLFYTVSRKLGQNHLATHGHGGGYQTVTVGGTYAELFERPNPVFEGNGQRVLGWEGDGSENNNPDLAGAQAINAAEYSAWDGNPARVIDVSQTKAADAADYYKFNVTDSGRIRYSIYEANTESHVTTDGPKSYTNSAVANQPMSTGYIPLKSDQYPWTRGGTGSLKNWSNLNAQGTDVTFATTLNHNHDQWANNDLPSGHNHGGWDITMNTGGLKPPKTTFHNDVQTHNLTPQNVPNAMTMNVDAETPSLNIIYIIRAY